RRAIGGHSIPLLQVRRSAARQAGACRVSDTCCTLGLSSGFNNTRRIGRGRRHPIPPHGGPRLQRFRGEAPPVAGAIRSPRDSPPNGLSLRRRGVQNTAALDAAQSCGGLQPYSESLMHRFQVIVMTALMAFSLAACNAAKTGGAAGGLPDDMSMGDPKAKVTVIEYASVGC